MYQKHRIKTKRITNTRITHIPKTPNVQNHKGKTAQTNTKIKKQQKLHSTKNIDIIKRHI